MSITTMSARDFARDLAQAKRAARGGPIFVTDRGVPTFAFLGIEDYYKLGREPEQNLLDVMESLPRGDFEFETLKLESFGLSSPELGKCLFSAQM